MQPVHLSYSKQIESLQSLVETLNEGKDKNGKQIAVTISSLEPTADTWPCVSNLVYSITQLGKNHYICLQMPGKDLLTKVTKSTEVILSQEYGSHRKSGFTDQKYLRNFFISYCCEAHGAVFIEAIGNVHIFMAAIGDVLRKPDTHEVCKDMPKRALTERFAWLQQRVQENNFPEDQQLLGKCHECGWGTQESYQDAFFWYHKSAEQGMPEAHCMLGHCYANGEGVERSAVKAFENFQKAANYGVKEAMQPLGYAYSRGLGVAKSQEKATGLFKKGIESKIIPPLALQYE